MRSDLKEALARQAAEAGFDGLRVTTPAAIPDAPARLAHFIALEHHGDMAWLAANAQRRGDPRMLWPETRSVIMLAKRYGVPDEPLAGLAERGKGTISCYAQGPDYHDVMKPALKAVAHWLQAATGGDVKVFVDTAPVMEKPLAAAAGLGWQGKHTNLVSRTLGSWFFLGAIFTTAEIAPDAPEIDHCGSCRRCLDICPTAAFPAPYRLDARRCISYLTIEHKGPIARELRPAMGNRIYGCDDCLAVCPWNKFAAAAREAREVLPAEWAAPDLAGLLELDDATFRQRFRGTPVKRTGRDRFLRNVLIAAGNSGDRALLPKVQNLLSDPSELVRGAAVWAFEQLADSADVQAARADYMMSETAPSVLAEWQQGGPA